MSAYSVVTCDLCFPNGPNPYAGLKVGGWTLGDIETAVAREGWQIQDDLDVCSLCVAIQQERQERDIQDEARSVRVTASVEEALAKLDVEEASLLAPNTLETVRAQAMALGVPPPDEAKWLADVHRMYDALRDQVTKTFGK